MTQLDRIEQMLISLIELLTEEVEDDDDSASGAEDNVIN